MWLKKHSHQWGLYRCSTSHPFTYVACMLYISIWKPWGSTTSTKWYGHVFFLLEQCHSFGIQPLRCEHPWLHISHDRHTPHPHTNNAIHACIVSFICFHVRPLAYIPLKPNWWDESWMMVTHAIWQKNTAASRWVCRQGWEAPKNSSRWMISSPERRSIQPGRKGPTTWIQPIQVQSKYISHIEVEFK